MMPVAMIGVEPLIIILVIVLVLFGGQKIPELLRGVGKGVGELQKGLDEGKRTLTNSIREDPPYNPPTAATTTTTTGGTTGGDHEKVPTTPNSQGS